MSFSVKKYRLTLMKKQYLKPNICAFYFSANQSLMHSAGQYLQLLLPHTSDERGTARYFSIASSPSEQFIMLSIKEGKSSFKRELFSLHEGSEIEAFGPMGQFILEEFSI